ncbi:hypothetical protein [Gordonia sp. (in: high G+C Gram-positive bacteria)]|jgi:hypothetical protein|uniref:hypothetical protein n=1 Tax=Gordonia sp. (in: high G+C Gram-positive bacteria) TaxID=84139 RepID=UPI001D317A40|nr:hypothetical protein [Gordonia sp. (in: high G+C Gram-positive bacteria)]MCB1293108.1 hypothetical protein [Gordonia sp. (in: high G+C Gram-positive bacteria)]HMS74960.1 hypothetical protein [Gordonia sp. (in: high G+C Gram-positive bacteria)]
MQDDYDQRLSEWARTYNGYERLAGGPSGLATLIEPLEREFEQSRRIPEWAGVELLRGWAFWLVRSHHHSGYAPLSEEYPQILAIAETINRHPGCRDTDRAPKR